MPAALTDAQVHHISTRRGGGPTTGDAAHVQEKLDQIAEAQGALVAEQTKMRLDLLGEIHAVQVTLASQIAESKATAREVAQVTADMKAKASAEDVARLSAVVAAMQIQVSELQRARWLITGAALVAGGLAGKLAGLIS